MSFSLNVDGVWIEAVWLPWIPPTLEDEGQYPGWDMVDYQVVDLKEWTESCAEYDRVLDPEDLDWWIEENYAGICDCLEATFGDEIRR